MSRATLERSPADRSSATGPRSGTGAVEFRHAPGLDGIRALAVAAVFAYHIGTTGTAMVLPGGFIGVDVFFVLSGYLITSLLVVEYRRTRHISIGQFYLRRARRLLPALFAVLLTVGVIGAYWLPQMAARLRGDLVAALGYFTNWWLIAQNSSYFGTTGDRPDLLTHLWSLAVEEQYYLVWPLVLIGFAAVRASRPVMLFVIMAAVAASTAAAWLLYDPFSDPSRVYYGTDTRALAPLLGAALAIYARPWEHRRVVPAGPRIALDVVGMTGLIGLAGVALVLHDTDSELYRGGFFVVAGLGAMLVASAGHPASWLGRVLGTQPLRWLGDRSYAIYLWHWPVCALTRPGVDVIVTGWANTALRIGLVLGLAESSYWLVERPIRRHGFLGRAGGRRTLAPVATAQRRAGAVIPAPRGATVYAVHAGRSRVAPVRAALLSLILLGGGGVVGVQLAGAATGPTAGGPVDLSPDTTLGPLQPTGSPSASPSVGPTVTAGPRPPAVPKGATVAFFGDSQGMTLLLNKPADLKKYINAVDATIEGCGVLLGKVASRSGEKRNLTSNCRNWQSEWQSRANQIKPAIAVIMIGAWDVFDLTLDSGTLPFGSAEWDANFMTQINAGVATLRAAHAQVALSLLPCYRPVRASAGFWPERGDDPRTRHVNDLLRAAAALDPTGVRTIDPPVQFCTDPKISRSLSYRWDGVHYYKPGAALYFKAVLPQLLAP